MISINSKSLLTITTILRILFGAVFIFSAFTKFMDLNNFAEALGRFKLLHGFIFQIFIYIIPATELLLGILLILGKKTSFFSQLATFMLALFTAVIIAKIYEGEEIDCGCFGNLTSGNIDLYTILRNVGFILISMYLTIYYNLYEEVSSKQTDNSIMSDSLLKKTAYKTIKSTLFVTIFFMMGVQTTIFALQNRELKNRILLITSEREVLKPNDSLKAVSVFDMQGDEIEINYDLNNKTKTLVYLLSVNCEPCKLNEVNWINLTDSLKNENLRIIGISKDSLNQTLDYLSNRKLNYNIYSAPSDEFKLTYKAFLTPQTILIDEKARVIQVWKGVLNAIKFKQVLANF